MTVMPITVIWHRWRDRGMSRQGVREGTNVSLRLDIAQQRHFRVSDCARQRMEIFNPLASPEKGDHSCSSRLTASSNSTSFAVVMKEC